MTTQRFTPGHKRSEGGFTLVELLVVLLFVAILSAIAIPIFVRQKEKGYADQIQSSLKFASVAVETYATENNGSYAGLDGQDGSALIAHGWVPPQYPYISYMNIEANAGTYCLEVEHLNATAASEWKQATYYSPAGSPQATPDTCPDL